MATEAPDPKTFESWEDAFQFPVTTVRGMEKQLRGELETNREKLRTLVGASYRDLLDTAERIMGMDESIQQVEANLGSLSERCNSRLMDQKGRNLGRWSTSTRAQDREHLTFASLLAFLQDCPLIISRLLRKTTSILLAAKVLVISRRVHRSVSQHPHCPPLVKSIHGQLASSWRKLLRHIDRQLSNVDITSSRLVEILCAYSLARSSSLTDTLKHFHHVRLEAVSTHFEGPHADRAKIVRALRLYSQTLLKTQAILPKPIMEALIKLKAQPLFQDAEIRATIELDLGVHERWMPEEIRQFTPWIGHDDLQKSEAERLLRTWADAAFSILLEGLRTSLATVQDFRALVQIRREVLETWFDGRNQVAVTTSVEPLDGLRSAINAQMVALVHARASRLHLVSGEVAATLQDRKAGITDQKGALWAISSAPADLLDGAVGFRKGILDRLHGRNDAVSRVLGGYHTWLSLVEEVAKVVKELRDQKWDEDLDDEDDEFGLESRQAQLSEDDPGLLEQELQDALSKAFEVFDAGLAKATEGVKEADGGDAPRQAAFLLRIIREVRRNLPRHQGEVGSFGLSLAGDLQSAVANATAEPALEAFGKSLRRGGTPVQARALWEGSPALPVQPSPAVFQLLHGLSTAMAEQGSDLWSPQAVRILKDQVRRSVVTAIDASVEGAEVNVNGESGLDDSEGSEKRTDRMIQSLYDAAFLREAMSAGDAKGDEGKMDRLLEKVTTREEVDGGARERIEKSAREYWKRTRLLFALLG